MFEAIDMSIEALWGKVAELKQKEEAQEQEGKELEVLIEGKDRNLQQLTNEYAQTMEQLERTEEREQQYQLKIEELEATISKQHSSEAAVLGSRNSDQAQMAAFRAERQVLE